MSALVSLFYLYDPWFLHFIRMGLITGSIVLLFLAYKWWNKSQKSVIIPKDSLIACIALLIISTIPLIINGTKEMGVLSMYVKSLFVFILVFACKPSLAFLLWLACRLLLILPLTPIPIWAGILLVLLVQSRNIGSII